MIDGIILVIPAISVVLISLWQLGAAGGSYSEKSSFPGEI
jgi:hypothetical protein